MKYRRFQTGDGSDTLYSPLYRETFHSKFGALTETRHVFLGGTGVDRRLARGQPTRILEVGFGAGLNFLATAHLSRTAGTPLRYVALEKEPLAADLLEQLNHGQLPQIGGDIRETFLKWRREWPQSLQKSRLRREFETGIRLELILGDAIQVQIPPLSYHAIYHDPFSPQANPELWSQDFLAGLYAVLSPGGKLATYSVKGAVRRKLQAAGFRVEKRPGPPGKREVLVAAR